jgi:hypothetical protein
MTGTYGSGCPRNDKWCRDRSKGRARGRMAVRAAVHLVVVGDKHGADMDADKAGHASVVPCRGLAGAGDFEAGGVELAVKFLHGETFLVVKFAVY